MCERKRRSPKTVPWGTLDVTSVWVECISHRRTPCVMFTKNHLVQWKVFPEWQSSRVCEDEDDDRGTLLNALLKSSKMTSIWWPAGWQSRGLWLQAGVRRSTCVEINVDCYSVPCSRRSASRCYCGQCAPVPCTWWTWVTLGGNCFLGVSPFRVYGYRQLLGI